MLARTVLPSLRHQALQQAARARPSTTPLITSQLRSYAKNHKKPNRPPPLTARPGSKPAGPLPTPKAASNAPTSASTKPNAAAAAAAAGEQSTPHPATPSTGSPEATFDQSQPEISDAPKPDAAADEKPFQLPDLTQGIPSTLAAELAQANRKAAGKDPAADDHLNLTEESTPAAESAGSGGDGGRERPEHEYVSSTDRRRNRMAKFTYIGLLVGALGGSVYYGRNWDTEEEEAAHKDEAPSGWSPGLFYARIKARLTDSTSYYTEPAFTKLLPEDDSPYKAPFTLVLSLEDLLIHNDWTREHGWRVAKRPGLDYFIRYLSQYYELVLFTSVPSMAADPILRKLDPFRIIRWPLFREATLYKKGEYVKDLSYLNRDLSKTLIIDTNPAHVQHQPENAIVLPKWTGDPKDTTLVDMIPFLEYLATMGFDDTRQVLASFKGTYIPEEFAKREKLIRDKFEADLAAEKARSPRRGGVNLLNKLLGIKPAPILGPDGTEIAAPADGLEQGKMVWDQIRERGQRQYQAIEKEIRENGEKWLAEMAAEEERMKEEQLKGMKSSVTGIFGGDKK